MSPHFVLELRGCHSRVSDPWRHTSFHSYLGKTFEINVVRINLKVVQMIQSSCKMSQYQMVYISPGDPPAVDHLLVSFFTSQLCQTVTLHHSL